MNDKETQEALLRESRLDWTLIRPVRLTDAPRDRYKIGDNLAWGLMSTVSRADVAASMLDAVEDAGTTQRALTVLSSSSRRIHAPSLMR
jgi:putative NADH-flavin reductase